MPELIPYNKKYLTSKEICEKLQAQGLLIDDINQAKQELERCSYYRFKAYLSPFKDNNAKKYNPNSHFEQGLDLYAFDSELRTYLFGIIEKIEIGVRSALDQWVTTQTANSFWYLDLSLFSRQEELVKMLSQLKSMLANSREEYAIHFRDKYYNSYSQEFRDLPPGWVALELMTFGNIDNLMRNFKKESIQTLKLNRFAKQLKIDSYAYLTNWMGSIRQVRNACGHHNRLFNRNLASPSGIKGSLNTKIQLVLTRSVEGRQQREQLNRLYTNICAIQKICQGLGHNEKIGPFMINLFNKYPTANLFRESMGFPEKWIEEPLLFDF